MPSRSKASSWLIDRVILILVFLTLTPIALFLTILSLIGFQKEISLEEKNTVRTFFSQEAKSVILDPGNFSLNTSIEETVVGGDSRPQLLGLYLKKHKSPLLGKEKFIVEMSDKYGLDFRLLVAIAQKESGLCRVIPEGSFNCWGWGVHSNGTLRFDSYEDGLEAVSKGIKENYIGKGYITIEQIMTKYANSASTTWAEGVVDYMNQISSSQK